MLRLFLGVLGVVMYVGPFETDFLAPNGVRELAIVDSKYNIIFLRIFGETTYSYGNTILLAELNSDVLVAHDLLTKYQLRFISYFVPNKTILMPHQFNYEDYFSESLDSTASTTIRIETCPTSCHLFVLDGKKHQYLSNLLFCYIS
jgi:hypothetical protein